MSFSCDQDWDKMKIAEGGRFCDICSKQVIDFTSRSVEEINMLKRSTGDLCGLFRAEQVDPALIPLTPPRQSSFVRLLLATLGFFGIETTVVKAQGNSSFPTEKLSDSCETFNPLKQNEIRETRVAEREEELVCDKTVAYVHPKKRLYLSRRFPFIVKRKRRIMGKF